MIDIDIKCKVRGRFKFTILDGDTLEVKRETDWMPNLIFNQGLERFGTNPIMGYCQVGSNNTAPNVAQTALIALVGATNNNITDIPTSNGANASPPYMRWTRLKYRFGVGVAAGNLSEVGMGWAASGGLWCRALIVDNVGTPTTITVLPTEILDVTYEMQLDLSDVSDVPFSIVIAGVTYNGVIRPAQVTTQWYGYGYGSGSAIGGLSAGSDWACVPYPGPIGAVTAQPAGGASTRVDAVMDPYSANSKRRDATFTWSVTQGNIAGGIGAVYMDGPWGDYQISFSPKIPKDGTKVLALRFRYSWDRF